MPFETSLGHKFKAENTVLSQEHVLLEDVHSLNSLLPQLLGQGMVTVEVLFKRSTHDGTVAIGRECTGQHTDIPKSTFQRFIQNIGDLILEVLHGHQGVKKLAPSITQHCMNLSASTTEVTVVVERFPEGQEGFAARLRPCIDQNHDFRIEDSTEGVE